MKYHSHCSIRFLLLSLSSLTLSCFASESPEKYPKLVVHGQNYSNACLPLRQDVLKNMLLATGVKASNQAWHAIATILCSPSDALNHDYVRSLVRKRIQMSLESTGETPEIRMVERSDELIDEILAEGKAWKADVQVESGKLVLQYFAREACIEAITLSFESGKWTISNFGVACD